MISNTQVSIGTEYTFDIFGSIGGQQTFTGTAIGVFDARYPAVQDSEELEVNLINNYPNLDAATKALLNNDPTFRAFPVLKIRDSQQVETNIAFPWIVDTTFAATAISNATVVIGDIASSDLTTLQNLLEANGYSVLGVTMN